MIPEIEEGRELGGYAGKILRIDLTNRTFEAFSTYKYVPHNLGGRALANRIFWDDVAPGTGAYDPENELIFTTGAPTGTGIPAAGRMNVCGVSPCSLPEMYSHSNMGGFFGGMLKYAGYDGLIVQGKADRHTYVYIEDDNVEFLDADGFIWGEYTHETQVKIAEKHGPEVQSVVIGPAGEHLHRFSSITNSNDSAAAKAGFGAVMGAKNLKAIAVMGHGAIAPANVEEAIKLHRSVGYPEWRTNPLVRKFFYGKEDRIDHCPGGWLNACLCCGYACNQICMNTNFNSLDPLHTLEDGSDARVTEIIKCSDPIAVSYTWDSCSGTWQNTYSERQENARGPEYDPLKKIEDYEGATDLKTAFTGSYSYNKLRINDPDDPALEYITTQYTGDRVNYYNANYKRGQYMQVLCSQYGLDKWNAVVWQFSWLSACKQEGLLDGIDLGMEVDCDSERFIKYFFDMVTYRTGPEITLADGSRRKAGDVFAEGVARAVRMLGKEKFGDSIYHNRWDQEYRKQLPMPVSQESGWGFSSHYQGRGMQGDHKDLWLTYTLCCMADSRDAVGSQHRHDTIEHYLEYKDDPCHSKVFAEAVVHNEMSGYLKDSLVTCEWKSPNLGWKDMEATMFNVATGMNITQEDLQETCMASMLVHRAIQIRDYGRTRDMEVEDFYYFLTYPDPYGERVYWDEFNDLVDLFYDAHGWDRKTGWPYRSTYEKYGLFDIADEMERLGKLPSPDNSKDYAHKANPFDR